MKKIMSGIIMLITIFTFGSVYAGEEKVELRAEKVINGVEAIKLEIESPIEIGVISGKIEIPEDVEVISINALNNWNLTYNDKTGEFVLYKVEGSTKEELLEIIGYVRKSPYFYIPPQYLPKPPIIKELGHQKGSSTFLIIHK